MENDDQTIGRILSRRQALQLLGTAALAASSAMPALARSGIVATPEQTEGPFFVDERLKRSDIRAGRVGTPLDLELRLWSLAGGARQPLAHAVVDIWHCDADGHYSDVDGEHGAPFLRGYQLTDAAGRAQFRTIYPGWYEGRTVHIHFKVRRAVALTQPPQAHHRMGPPPGGGFGPPPGPPPGAEHRAHELTSQLYLPDSLTDAVHARRPYNTRGQRQMRNHDDFIFRDGGEQLLLRPTRAATGYRASFDVQMVI